MKILHYNSYDESTDEYETGDIANVDADLHSEFVTIYTENKSWYVVLNENDLRKLVEAIKQTVQTR